MNKFALIVMTGILFVSTFAFAKSMTCPIGVVKASDMINPSAPGLKEKVTALAEVPVDDDKGEIELTVNDEQVEVVLYRRPYADVYDMNVVLTTPEADRRQGTKFVAILSDFLINGGPSTDNGYEPNVKPGSTRFDFMNHKNGTLAMTPKLIKAMKTREMWGKGPFTSGLIDIMHSNSVADAVKELASKGDLNEKDVVAIYTVFNCTLNK